MFPVLLLVDTALVGLGELGLGLACQQAHGELGHGVHGLREGTNEGLHVGRELGACAEIGCQGGSLLGSGDLRCEEEPDEGLGGGFSLTGGTLCSGELLLELGDRVSTEANTFLCIEEGSLVVHALDIAATANALIDSHLSKRHVTILGLEILEGSLLGRDLILKDLLQALRYGVWYGIKK